jgi:hypothetical protein
MPEPGPSTLGLSTVVVDIEAHYAEIAADRTTGLLHRADRLKVHLATQLSYVARLDAQTQTTLEARIAMAPRPAPIDQRLATALSNPLRARAFELIAEGVASPKLIAGDLDLDVRTVAYHVRVLHKLGCIELMETRPRRGAVEHVYRVVKRNEGKT